MQSQGTLAETSLKSLLEAAQGERSTGTLTVRNGSGKSASLYFLFGHLFHAQSDGMAGDDAVVSALTWNGGEFEFDPKAKLPSDETVKAAIAAGKQTGIKVVTDMIGVKDIAARSCVVTRWGVDMIYLHYAADQRRADGARDSTQWLEAVLAVTDVPVGLATFGAEDAARAAKGGAQLVAIGHPLFESADVLGALKHYVEQVKANYQPGK